MRRALQRVAGLVSKVPTINGKPIGRIDLDRVPWAALSAAHLAALRDVLPGSAATKRQAMCAVRGVLARIGPIDSERMEATAVQVPRRRPKPWAAPELGAGASTSQLRDAALAALVCGLGLRPGVAVQLDVSAFRSWRLAAPGRRRPVPMPDNISDVVAAWVAVRGAQPGALLCVVNRGGRIGGAMTSGAAHKRLARVTKPSPFVPV
jgi:integrase